MKNQIPEYYRRRAPEYEQIYYRDNPERRQEIAEEVSRLQALSRQRTVLDVATGTGYWAQAMSQTAADITAFDLSAEMIREARRKNFKCEIDFVVADLHQPPFQKSLFDLITMGFWFSHEPKQNYAELLAKLVPLLKPDGIIWLIDNNPPAEGPTNDSVGSDSFGNNYKRRSLGNGQKYVILKNYFSETELHEVFENILTMKQLYYGQYYWSVAAKPKYGK